LPPGPVTRSVPLRSALLNVTVTCLIVVFAVAPLAGLVDRTSVWARAIVAPPSASVVARIETQRLRCGRISGRPFWWRLSASRRRGRRRAVRVSRRATR
jgi:hypothetical protein